MKCQYFDTNRTNKPILIPLSLDLVETKNLYTTVHRKSNPYQRHIVIQKKEKSAKKEINKSEYSSFLSILNIPNIEQDAKKNKITK